MSKVLVNESSLTGIANAIRGKNGSTTTYKPSEMAAAITAISGGGEPTIEALSITANGTYTAPDGVDGYSPVTVNVPQDGGPPESAFVISRDCSYRFAYNGWNWFISQYENRITTSEVMDTESMFCYSDIKNVPFDINYKNSLIYDYYSITNMFNGCSYIEKLPILNNIKIEMCSYLFRYCYRLRNIPDNFASTWDWSYLEQQTIAYTGNQQSMFYNCYSLRSIPINIIKSGNPYCNYSYSYFNNGFQNCHSLNELVNLPIPYTKSTWTSNAFYNTFTYCSRLKNAIFALQEDGTPYVVKWKSQIIDFSNCIGWLYNNTDYKNYILNYNSGITADKEVTDATTYAALKDDPDWFTCDVAYSRYNHDSAVATINSLPDTSAYLASKGGTNTIKFKGAAGSATDGGAINSLTEEEIAVAAAKGWTVTLV